ncbi:unnamed protein product [Mytilus coruscus]|uniref:Uncharacterized protein n=1 Tax=Mytilus coruscus TaxID=42192 RepID=A0A6J8DJX2_MYTCO|nr:unnamed protein product [Mytilus coruscus]
MDGSSLYEDTQESITMEPVSPKSVRTSKEPVKTTGKKKKVSKSEIMQSEYDRKLQSMEENFNCKLDKLFGLLASNNQNRESLLRSDCVNIGNLPSGESRPLISLEPNLDQNLGLPRVSRNQDFDNRSEISIHVHQTERHDLDMRSDYDSGSGGSPVRQPNDEFILQNDNVNNRKCE